MKTYIILTILILFFLYMVVWSLKLFFFSKRQRKVKRARELRAKGNEIKKRTIDCTKDYWYNLREVEDCKEGEDFEKYYHYFIGVDQGVKELLVEMYDCGIVRMDELEEIAYGKNHLRNVDLSFLEELEREMGIDGSAEFDLMASSLNDEGTEETEEEESEEIATDDVQEVVKKDNRKEEDSTVGAIDDIIEIEGLMGGFFSKKTPDIVTASKELKKDDPGITDIRGTLSEGVENVIAAVEAEKKEQEEKNEPIMKKQEKSVEEARKAREMTANAETRNKIYEKWVGYVFELYEMININANEDTKHKIRKALMDYGYNDVDVLLESPE